MVERAQRPCYDHGLYDLGWVGLLCSFFLLHYTRVGWRHTTFADLSPVIANPPPIARLDTPSQSHFYWRIEGTILSLKTLITVPSISPFPLDIQHGIYILCTCVAVGWLHRLKKIKPAQTGFILGGDGGSRTRVRKIRLSNLYEHSQLFRFVRLQIN